MIAANGFVRSIGFAAVAAAAWFPWVLLLGPLIGWGNARVAYLVAVTALYAAGVASAGQRRLAVFVAVSAAASLLAAVAHHMVELAVGLAAILGLARSAFLYRAAPARAVTLEVCLLVSGLCFARFLAGPSPASTALAVWGFLLVQSLFFVVGGVRMRADEDAHGDAFEEAHRRAEALLERL